MIQGYAIRKAGGFTMIELLVALAISMFVIAGTTTLFAQLFSQYKRESRVAQTDIGSALGLDYLRKDIQSAGYGLPWDVSGLAYNEYVGGDSNAAAANDAGNPPRAVVALNNAGQFNSDYLVIKSVSVPVNNMGAGKTEMLQSTGPRTWVDPSGNETPAAGDWVIVLSSDNTLVLGGGQFSTQFNNLGNFEPTDPSQVYMVYDVATPTPGDPLPTGPSMPFNRADYFITPHSGNIPASGTCPAASIQVPARCNANTGELVKAVLNQTSGCFDYYPIVDCAADMQVTFELAGGGIIDAGAEQAQGLTAAQIRQQTGGVGGIEEIRVFVLAQEGQMDPNYTFPAAQDPIQVGDPGLGDQHQVANNNQQHYRWKVYTVIEKPFNLGVQ